MVVDLNFWKMEVQFFSILTKTKYLLVISFFNSEMHKQVLQPADYKRYEATLIKASERFAENKLKWRNIIVHVGYKLMFVLKHIY